MHSSIFNNNSRYKTLNIVLHFSCKTISLNFLSCKLQLLVFRTDWILFSCKNFSKLWTKYYLTLKTIALKIKNYYSYSIEFTIFCIIRNCQFIWQWLLFLVWKSFIWQCLQLFWDKYGCHYFYYTTYFMKQMTLHTYLLCMAYWKLIVHWIFLSFFFLFLSPCFPLFCVNPPIPFHKICIAFLTTKFLPNEILDIELLYLLEILCKSFRGLYLSYVVAGVFSKLHWEENMYCSVSRYLSKE